ncbi:MAG: MFS transporter [Chloroflexota bacterium]
MSDDVTSADAKLNFKRILPVFIIVLVDIMGMTIIIPLLPLYSAAFGANAFTIGLLSATFPAMQFIASPILGSLSDRFGRKPVLVISQIGTFLGFILLGLANALPILFLSRVIDGISGGNIATAKASITDCTNEKTRTQGLGLIGAAFGIGFVIGPAISAIALVLFDGNFRIPAYIAAGFSLASFLLTTFWFEETHVPNQNKQTVQKTPYFQKLVQALSHPVIGGLLFLLFVQQLIISEFEQLIPLFTLNRLGMQGTGNAVLFLFMGLLVAIIQGYLIGPLSRKLGERRLIYGGLVMLAIGMIGVSLIPEQPLPSYSQAETLASLASTTSEASINVDIPDGSNTGYLGVTLLFVMLLPVTIGGYLVMPSINSLITQTTSASEQGQILGISTSIVSMAHIIAPIAGGALFRWGGSTIAFLAGGILVALVVLALPLPISRLTFWDNIPSTIQE